MAQVASMDSGWSAIITPLLVTLGVSVSASVGLIFGTYSARQAAKVSWIQSLRYK